MFSAAGPLQGHEPSGSLSKPRLGITILQLHRRCQQAAFPSWSIDFSSLPIGDEVVEPVGDHVHQQLRGEEEGEEEVEAVEDDRQLTVFGRFVRRSHAGLVELGVRDVDDKILLAPNTQSFIEIRGGKVVNTANRGAINGVGCDVPRKSWQRGHAATSLSRQAWQFCLAPFSAAIWPRRLLLRWLKVVISRQL